MLPSLGDAAVARMIEAGVLKQYVLDGVVMVSSRNVVVGEKEGNLHNATLTKVDASKTKGCLQRAL